VSAELRCVVVGGGLIGSHTASRLVAAGHRVTVYSRSFSAWIRDQRAAGLEVDLVEGNVPGGDRFDELLSGADAAFAFVGYSTPALSARDPVSAASGWLIPVLAVLERSRRAGVGRVVLATSGGTIYGQAETVPTPEDAPLQPISMHGTNSIAIEAYARHYSRTGGVDTVALRFANIDGPGERVLGDQGVIAAWCAGLARNEALVQIGDGAERRDFLYAEDAGEAAVAALGAAPGVYNIGSGGSVSLAELLELIVEVVGREPDVNRRPGRAVDVRHSELDCTRFHEQTGWEPRLTLTDGLARTWSWMTSNSASLRAELGGVIAD
jgi:UDP-glucose 4-epimerase